MVNAFRSGSNIYGAAAMKSAAKMLRGNAITGAVSVVVLSSFDIANIFRGRISGKQLFKNIANTTATVAGGSAGWVGGAAAGAAIGSAVPVIGTAIGGIIGGLAGSLLAGGASSKISNVALSVFIEDDAEEMVNIIENVFKDMAVEYLLNEDEANRIVKKLSKKLTGKSLRDMFASDDRKNFARNLLTDLVEEEIRNREHISLPTKKNMVKGLKLALESMN